MRRYNAAADNNAEYTIAYVHAGRTFQVEHGDIDAELAKRRIVGKLPSLKKAMAAADRDWQASM